ncbi:MAG: 3-ketoacyl-ACP reductase [Fuerstiella sp.]|nr:3-ketoacyl-ACP reductase [Fuerstiella sp.]MCP4855317.1 3-ketoacyl-ACP reductase [Fuerstiella sp.]
MSRPVALITGGSRGIGLGCAKSLAAAGFDIAINGLREETQVSEPIAELKALGARVVYCRGDIALAETRAATIDRIRSEFGRLHVLVNNAGVAPKERVDLLDGSEASFDRVMGINLKGPYFLTQIAARWMIEQKVAEKDSFFCIINVGSVSATAVSTHRGEYCVAKAGLAMMNALYATRLGPHDIPVYEVRPGIVKTNMTSGVEDKYDKLIEDGLCVTPRWGRTEDVGKAVSTLATGVFPYSTGQVIMVDGGMTLPRL